MQLFSVYDADGAHFRMVDESEAQLLLEQNAARLEGRKKVKLRLSVDCSAARALLTPRSPVSQASKTFRIERIGDRRTPLYQHDDRRCNGYADTLSDLVTACAMR